MKKPREYTDQEFFNDIMMEAEELIQKEQAIINAYNNRILKAIKSVKGEEFIECLTTDKYDNDEYPMAYTHGKFRLTRNPIGDYQKEDYGVIKGVWIRQFTGYECDDYYGTISVQLKDNLWLEMDYSC